MYQSQERGLGRRGHQKRTACSPRRWQKVRLQPRVDSVAKYICLFAENLIPPAETPKHGSVSWNKVAEHIPGRNNKDCRKRWHYSIANTIRKGTWTREEDERLREAVELYGARWSKIAEAVGTRNGDQCWKRWYDCLDPRIDKGPWKSDEVCPRYLLKTVGMRP